jgi:hypothetical protein
LYFSVHFYGYYDFVNSNDISKRYQSSTSKTVPSQIMAYKNRKSTLSHLLSSKGEIFSQLHKCQEIGKMAVMRRWITQLAGVMGTEPKIPHRTF